MTKLKKRKAREWWCNDYGGNGLSNPWLTYKDAKLTCGRYGKIIKVREVLSRRKV